MANEWPELEISGIGDGDGDVTIVRNFLRQRQMMSEQNGPEREVDVSAKLDCWRSLIDEARRAAGDQGAIVATTLSDAEMDRKFDAGFGLPEGVPFALWTEARVYFPACYDGSEWVASAPRNPCSETIEHVG